MADLTEGPVFRDVIAGLAAAGGLFWCVRGPDEERICGEPDALPPSCMPHTSCPLVTAGAHCAGAASVRPNESGFTGYLVVACHGEKAHVPPQAQAEALADAWATYTSAGIQQECTARETRLVRDTNTLPIHTPARFQDHMRADEVAFATLRHLVEVLHSQGGCIFVGESKDTLQALSRLQLSDKEVVYLHAALVGEHSGMVWAAPQNRRVISFGSKTVLVHRTCHEDGQETVLAVCRPAEHAYNAAEMRLLEALGRQASLALRNRLLMDELRDFFVNTIQALVATIDAKDTYTFGHSQRVAQASRRTAEAIGLDRGYAEDIHTAAMVHDIGKIGVDTGILRKNGRLDDKEWQEVQQHPDRGAGIIGCVPQLRHLVEAVRHHHERYDGGGYPGHLADEHIPFGARIIAVCDAYDAMVSTRPYRRALSHDEACRELLACKGAQFDMQVVQAFLDVRAA